MQQEKDTYAPQCPDGMEWEKYLEHTRTPSSWALGDVEIQAAAEALQRTIVVLLVTEDGKRKGWEDMGYFVATPTSFDEAAGPSAQEDPEHELLLVKLGQWHCMAACSPA